MKKNVVIVIFMVMIAAFGIFAVYKKSKDVFGKSDGEKFSEEYTEINGDNPFVYRSLSEINKILENGTGIVYLGFPECPWCQRYVVYLNDVAKDYELEKIYYANILEDRNNKTEDYQKTISLISEYLQYDEEGNKKIYVPSIIAVYKGEIVGFDDETSWDTKGFDTPDEYWDTDSINALKSRLEEMIAKVNNNICTDCND